MRTNRFVAIAATSVVVALAACSNDMDKKTDSAAPAASPVAAATSAAAPALDDAYKFGDAENVQPGPDATGAPADTNSRTVVRGRVTAGTGDIIKIASLT